MNFESRCTLLDERKISKDQAAFFVGERSIAGFKKFNSAAC